MTTKTFAQRCARCEHVVDMLVHGEWEVAPAEDSLPETWTAAECPKCHGSSLYLREYYNYGTGHPDDGWGDYYRIYPPQARRLSIHVPKSLREDHAEAVKCLEAQAYKAAAVMCRRVVEGIAGDQGYTKGDLFKRLEKMRDDAVIDARLYEWADICRDVGNQGAHATKSAVIRDDAESALEFVEALLDYLYVFQNKYNEFKERRDEAKQATSSKPAKKP